MKRIIEEIKKYGIIATILLLITAITLVVNLLRDIKELKEKTLTEKQIREIVQQETKELEFIKEYLINH